MPLAKEKGIKILPVDSEHSAIFQSLQGSPADRIEKIILTCSGGPFRGMTRDELATKTPEDALKHPNWNMGRKITIDSASLVNKGLEVMEAAWLFGVGHERVCVTVHPQSVLHSAVEFKDGAVIGQMGTPDMKLPINYALFYPDRMPMKSEKLDLFKVGALTFEKPDTDTFRGLALAYDAANAGGTMPTVFNAANEEAVARFLDHKIGFLDIYEEIEKAMNAHKVIANPTVAQILDAEKEARENA
jgi:1-deoxy-D-xylulose-5-phosphate reductoisomerase